MNCINRTTLLGNVGKPPELRHTASGKAVASFRMATTESWRGDDGEKGARTEWHRIIVWGPSGEACAQYLRKGARVYVEGRLQTRSYEKAGQQVWTTEVVAEQVVFLDRRDSSQDSVPEDGVTIVEPEPTPPTPQPRRPRPPTAA